MFWNGNRPVRITTYNSKQQQQEQQQQIRTLSYVDDFLIARHLVFCKKILKESKYIVKDSQV